MIGSKLNTISGLVLSQTQYGNESAIVSIATDNGISSFIANNVYKKKSNLKPLLLSFSLVNIEYITTSNDVNIAKYAESIIDPTPLYQIYSNNMFLNLAIEITDKLFKFGDSFPKEETLLIIKALLNNKNVLSCALLFLGSIYKSLGLKENIESCIFCSKSKNIVAYNLVDGGIICKDCADKNDIAYLDNLDIQCFRYAFMKIDDDLLSKVVPLKNGKKILTDLCLYLSAYFDLNQFKFLPFFIDSLK